jgi:phage terminase large subunit GpA-like protein
VRDVQARELGGYLRGIWRAEPDVPVWLWAERNIVLSAMESADMAGPFSSSVTPFIREPLECFRDPSVHEVTLVFATQVCKTLMIMLGVAWWLTHNSGRCIWVMDTADNARSFSETRWQPLIRDCPALAALMPSDRDEFKNMQQRLGNSLIHFVGSNSPGNLAQRPGDLIVMDEVDKFAVTTSREANAVDLVEQRTKARANTLIVKTSSPTVPEGLIWKSWLQGDQRQFFVRCPLCGEMILLEFPQVKWDQSAKGPNGWNFELVSRTARYICQKCGGVIHDGVKTAMLRSHDWLPTNPDAPPGVRSYQLTSLYSPWSKTTFGGLAVEFLKHKARWDTKGWDNGYMARPSEFDAEGMDWQVLAARRERYLEGHLGEAVTALPDGCRVLTAFCDVQDSWLEWFCWGWGDGTENWLLEHIRIEGPPSHRYTWAALREIVLATRAQQIDWTFIDYGGHFGQESIEFVKSMAGQRVYLCRGDTNISAPVNSKIARTKKPIVRLFQTGVGNAKRRILAMFKVGERGPGYCHFPDEADDEFFEQLCAEELRPKHVRGARHEEWFQTRPRNEALDGMVGCYAGLKRLPEPLLRARFAGAAGGKVGGGKGRRTGEGGGDRRKREGGEKEGGEKEGSREGGKREGGKREGGKREGGKNAAHTRPLERPAARPAGRPRRSGWMGF